MSHHPRKRFGQHFLCDQAIVHRIVSAIAPSTKDHLIEIGPGQGAITLPVIRAAKMLEVVELDRDLIPQLEERVAHAGHLQIHEADALTFDFASLQNDKRPLRIFGNLPYNISTPLLFHLLTYSACIQDMVFMLQKEVVDRMAAAPNSEHYGRLSVMVQYHCQTQKLFDVPPQAFFPPPKVMSSIVKLLPYQSLPFQANDYQLFANIVRDAFGQRRKTLRNSLKNWVTDAVWSAVDIASDRRAETLSVGDFVTLANAV